MQFVNGQCRSKPVRVVITGAGIITALGKGWEINARGFREGQSAFRPVTRFDASRQRAKFAAEVDIPEPLPVGRLSAKEQRRLDHATRLLLSATAEALTQANWGLGQTFPMILGTTSCGMNLGERFFIKATEQPHGFRGQASLGLHYQAQRQGLAVQAAFDFNGPVIFIANACASGANAIGHAFDLIRHGRAERALAGGYDAISQLVFCGFDALQALSTTRCRPFDTARDGLALGEGAAILTLESEASARARGATILGEIAGYGMATDGHHLTQPHPEGNAALQSMREATAMAGITPEAVEYLNAHGTGTPLNDSAEAAAVNRWAGGHAPQLWVSSTKGAIGHLLGAAGAVEAVATLMVLREQWLPPNVGLEQPDPACAFPLVREPMSAACEYAATNSFGFGGCNATLILRRWS